MTRDPQALRALAHPLRWKLIDVLEREGSATATRCAELLGESVASCAYHLGILAKYGYIEADPARAGREKPWRITERQQRLGGEELDLEGQLASEAAVDAFLEHEFGRIRRRVRQRDLQPPDWRQAGSVLGSTMWITAAELQEIRQQLLDLATRYADRDDDASRRPQGARHVRLFAATTVAALGSDAETAEPGEGRE
ncbi:ArsR family transcriptional regulator [Streptacidiphilus pinicola]|uniref:ArsR family transcriptional regulator n=1 Tax=Streptacidiphilus pinicola TaxID=2219663 RepID=A0A2X0J0Q6_9ACTN|nr:winged helix-turn-helix domain-containing protein [Streptacidiphilus pinicola]RAG80888.1 ArsR family transcriptional regulator [Streptacidiphilus pinicola]